MDLGAAGNLVSPDLVKVLQLATQRLEAPFTIRALDGHPVGWSINHQEELKFLILPVMHYALILGLP